MNNFFLKGKNGNKEKKRKRREKKCKRRVQGKENEVVRKKR